MLLHFAMELNNTSYIYIYISFCSLFEKKLANSSRLYAAVKREIQIYWSGGLAAAKIDGGQPYRPVKAANAEFNRTTRRFIART